ncbi:MAG: hypothetical protein OEM39_06045, partial [Acidimicrobiia bacterium]|nr:hypothetical protein [Acidimicrobiia bacterium]
DSPLLLPATIRVPVPGGVDPDRLILYRLEGDGTLTLLHTTVEDGTLVAYTPGFSVLGVLQSILEEGGPTPPPLTIEGPEMIAVGSAAFYFAPHGAAIDVAGEARVFDHGPRLRSGFLELPTGSVMVQPKAAGELFVTARWSDPDSAYRASAVLRVEVVEPWEEALLHMDGGVQFGPVGRPVEVVLLAAYDGPTPAPELGFLINFDDGAISSTGRLSPFAYMLENGDEIEGTSQPPDAGRIVAVYRSNDMSWATHTYRRAGTYNVSVTATGGDLSISRTYPVTIKPMEVELVQDRGGAQIGIPVTVRWIVEGGTRPYRSDFAVKPTFPAESAIAGLQATFTFQEAGSHLIEVTITDANGETASDSAYVAVLGDPVSIELEGPSIARVGEQVTIESVVQGGNVIAYGQREGYTLTVDWGDETGSTPMSAKEGTTNTFTATHTYTKPSEEDHPFEVIVIATTWALDGQFRDLEIVVTEPPDQPEPGPLPWTFRGTGTVLLSAKVEFGIRGQAENESDFDLEIVIRDNGSATGTFTFYGDMGFDCSGLEGRHGDVDFFNFSEGPQTIPWNGTYEAATDGASMGSFSLHHPWTDAEVTGTFNADSISGDSLFVRNIPPDRNCNGPRELLTDIEFENIPRQR